MHIGPTCRPIALLLKHLMYCEIEGVRTTRGLFVQGKTENNAKNIIKTKIGQVSNQKIFKYNSKENS